MNESRKVNKAKDRPRHRHIQTRGGTDRGIQRFEEEGVNCIREPKQHCTGQDSGPLTGQLHWDGEGYSTVNTGCEGNERRQAGRMEQDSENILAVKEKKCSNG